MSFIARFPDVVTIQFLPAVVLFRDFCCFFFAIVQPLSLRYPPEPFRRISPNALDRRLNQPLAHSRRRLGQRPDSGLKLSPQGHPPQRPTRLGPQGSAP